MNTRRVVVNGVDLEVVEAGAGGRPLLLVHGFGGSKEDFTDYLPRLGAIGWHAVSFDHRGHGNSDKPTSEDAYSLQLLADDVDALLDTLGWPRATVLGHSMGGMVVQTWLLQHLDRLEALILMDTSPAMPESFDPATIELGVAVVREGGTALLLEAQADTDGGPLTTPAFTRMAAADRAYQAWSDAKTLACAAPAWVGLASSMVSQPDRTEALHQVTVPTLVILGAEDEPFDAACKALAGAIPSATLAVIPDAGHSPQFEAPAVWWAVVLSFLDSL